MISIDWVGDSEVSGYEIRIPFYDWDIIISVKDFESIPATEDIQICDADGTDITEKYLMFKGVDMDINPTGKNLYQIMDILMTNLKERNKKND